MLFKKKRSPKLVNQQEVKTSCQGNLTTSIEQINIYEDDTIIRYPVYSIYHFDNIEGVHPFNCIGQKIYNQLTGYKEELTNS